MTVGLFDDCEGLLAIYHPTKEEDEDYYYMVMDKGGEYPDNNLLVFPVIFGLFDVEFVDDPEWPYTQVEIHYDEVRLRRFHNRNKSIFSENGCSGEYNYSDLNSFTKNWSIFGRRVLLEKYVFGRI